MTLIELKTAEINLKPSASKPSNIPEKHEIIPIPDEQFLDDTSLTHVSILNEIIILKSIYNELNLTLYHIPEDKIWGELKTADFFILKCSNILPNTGNTLNPMHDLSIKDVKSGENVDFSLELDFIFRNGFTEGRVPVEILVGKSTKKMGILDDLERSNLLILLEKEAEYTIGSGNTLYPIVELCTIYLYDEIVKKRYEPDLHQKMVEHQESEKIKRKMVEEKDIQNKKAIEEKYRKSLLAASLSNPGGSGRQNSKFGGMRNEITEIEPHLAKFEDQNEYFHGVLKTKRADFSVFHGFDKIQGSPVEIIMFNNILNISEIETIKTHRNLLQYRSWREFNNKTECILKIPNGYQLVENFTDLEECNDDNNSDRNDHTFLRTVADSFIQIKTHFQENNSQQNIQFFTGLLVYYNRDTNHVIVSGYHSNLYHSNHSSKINENQQFKHILIQSLAFLCGVELAIVTDACKNTSIPMFVRNYFQHLLKINSNPKNHEFIQSKLTTRTSKLNQLNGNPLIRRNSVYNHGGMTIGAKSAMSLTGPHANPTVWSLSKEFDLFKTIGEGGFGSVIKARKKLEDRYYAVKKVMLPSGENPRVKEVRQKILREVRVWPSLYHENIVRYYTCWQETEFVKPSSTTETVTLDDADLSRKSTKTSKSSKWSKSQTETSDPESTEADTSGSESEFPCSWTGSFVKNESSMGPRRIGKITPPKGKFFQSCSESDSDDVNRGQKISEMETPTKTSGEIIFRRAAGASYAFVCE